MKEGQTFGQWLNWDFEANGNIHITDRNGNSVYYEVIGGRWCKRERDSQGNQIYFESSDGVIIDRRSLEIIEHNGKKYQLIPNQNQNP